MKRFLGASSSALQNLGNEATTKIGEIFGIVMPIIFAVVTMMAIIYTVILGVKFAKAEDSEKREEAKKRLITAAIGFGIAIIVSAVLWGVLTNIKWAEISA